MKLYLLAIGFGLLAGSNALADDSAPGMETLLFQEVVTVASQEAETLQEAPVITTVVTAEQIVRMGARTLNDVLLTIPGFSRIQDHNEYYSAERGIYASSQQKILVLRDGHRLNSRCYSEANFGPAISLANVKRIEVMRGPGSTLYGDVALTAVINIVTKDGADMNGGQVTVGYGNFDQKKIDVVAGYNADEKLDLMVFGSFYSTVGEKREVDASSDYAPNPMAGVTVLDRFNEQPAYDFGVKASYEDLRLLYSHRYDHYTMPRAGGGGYGQLIDYDAYRTFEGESVGSSSEFEHLEIKYAPKIGAVELGFRPYYDTFVFRDNEPVRRAGEPGSLPEVAKGYFMKWLERSYGIQVTAGMGYEAWGRGKVLLGLQPRETNVYDSWDINTPDPTHAAWWVGDPKVMRPGKEQNYGFMGQVKHHFNEQIILNAGLRYDLKHRLNNENISALSPRAALMYFPLEDLSLRLNYAKSFVDSPYWYRYNQKGGGYAGGEGLKPEFLDSFQFTVAHELTPELQQTLNVFYNDFKDVVYRNALGVYTNAGSIKSQGLEYEINWRAKDILDARANYTYQFVRDAIGFLVGDYMLENVPAHLGNLVVDYAPFNHLLKTDWGKHLWFNAQLRYVGPQLAPWGKSGNYAGKNLDYRLEGVFLTNAGLTYTPWESPRLTVGFHCYNVFDVRYRQGGSVNLPYEQPGRWFLGDVTYAW